jgi:DNA ligase-1
MAPKRQARQATPPSAKKVKKASKPAQPSIDSFFASPIKGKAVPKPTPKKDNTVITIDDSDDDVLPGSPVAQEQQDAKLARKLAEEWDAGDSKEGSNLEKGKGRSESPEIESVDPSPARSGVNGSSSSKKLLEPVKLEQGSTSKDVKPVHPMFAGPSRKRAPSPTPLRDVKPETSSPQDVKPATITSTSAEVVKAIDFDTDAFLFRPSVIDISNWPKGRLPYSVLVGVYVQVSSTRSRLTIVRVLTKYVASP